MGPRRRERPVPPPKQIMDALRRALIEQDRALEFYLKGGSDGGRHARAARLLTEELLAGVGTEIHNDGPF